LKRFEVDLLPCQPRQTPPVTVAFAMSHWLNFLSLASDSPLQFALPVWEERKLQGVWLTFPYQLQPRTKLIASFMLFEEVSTSPAPTSIRPTKSISALRKALLQATRFRFDPGCDFKVFW
jgi:hypothetical protein